MVGDFMSVEKKKDKNDQKWLFVLILLIGAATLYSFIISKDILVLEWIALGMTGFFVLWNFYYLMKNKKIMTRMKKAIPKRKIDCISLNPIDASVIYTSWYHKQLAMGKREISILLDYLVSKGYMIEEEEEYSISPSLSLPSLGESDRYLLKLFFLKPSFFHQKEELRMEKLEKFQKGGKLPIEEILRYSIENTRDNSSFRELVQSIKGDYFIGVENATSAFVTMASMIFAFFNLFLALSFLKEPTLWTFYLPVVGAVLLVLGITSKYRERVILRSDKKESVIETLNYLSEIQGKDTRPEIYYLGMLGLLPKEREEQFEKIFRE